jgi:hypothetical protein
MPLLFEIEFAGGPSRAPEYYVARQLPPLAPFELSERSRLGEVPIKASVSAPRALDAEGRPRLDVFIFRPVSGKNVAVLHPGQVVELHP